MVTVYGEILERYFGNANCHYNCFTHIRSKLIEREGKHDLLWIYKWPKKMLYKILGKEKLTFCVYSNSCLTCTEDIY